MDDNKRSNHERIQSDLNYKRSRQNNFNNDEQEQNELLFNIKQLNFYNRDFPFMKRPLEIGSFVSETRHKNIKEKILNVNESSCNYGVRYLVLPKELDSCYFDLNKGSSDYKLKPSGGNGIDYILKWIMKNQSINSDFVCWRGLITKLLLIPYEKKNDLMFSVTKYKDTYYLREFETEKQMNERLNIDEKSLMFTYWGYKFESYITSDTENGCISENINNETIDPDDNYCTLVKTQIGSHSFIYGAEVDCCISSNHKSLDNYCEIKTSKGMSKNDLNLSRNIKFLKWWIQSFLINIKRIIVGLRNDDGIVTRVVEYSTQEIFKSVQSWNVNICFNFLIMLFNFIKSKCNQEDSIFLFTWEPNSNVIKCKKVIDSKYSAVPNWFKI